MAETTQTTPAAKAMTAAEAARAVKRKIVERKPVIKGGSQVRDESGAPVFDEIEKEVPIAASEELAFKDYGTHVVVVTKDGKKFSSAADE